MSGKSRRRGPGRMSEKSKPSSEPVRDERSNAAEQAGIDDVAKGNARERADELRTTWENAEAASRNLRDSAELHGRIDDLLAEAESLLSSDTDLDEVLSLLDEADDKLDTLIDPNAITGR